MGDARPAGKPRRWHTWQPTIWVLRRRRSGLSAPLRPPVRLRRHGSGNESRSEKDSPRRFENWASMTSEVEARSGGTYSTTYIGPFVASHSDRDRSQQRARKPTGARDAFPRQRVSHMEGTSQPKGP